MIDNRIAVNKTAAIVISSRDDPQVTHSGHSTISSMVPLPTIQWLGPRKDDLTGRRVGRFIVIGYALWRPNNWRTSTNNTRWVVRCTCGRYQMLSTKAVKKQHEDNACAECRKTTYLKHHSKL